MDDFGFDITNFNVDDYGTEFNLPDSDKPLTRTMTLTLSEEQFEIIQNVINFVVNSNMQIHEFGNTNKQSNLLFEVVYLWAKQKNLL